MIAHHHLGTTAGHACRDLDRGTRGCVGQGIGDEVGDRLAQMILHAVDHHRLGCVERDPAVGVDGDGVAAGVGGQDAEIDDGRFDVAPLVEACQQQQVVDEGSHALRLLLDAPHDHFLVDVLVGDTEAEQFGEALDGSQWRA